MTKKDSIDDIGDDDAEDVADRYEKALSSKEKGQVAKIDSNHTQGASEHIRTCTGGTRDAPRSRRTAFEIINTPLHQPQGHAPSRRSTILTPGSRPQPQDHARRSHSDFPVWTHPPTSDKTQACASMHIFSYICILHAYIPISKV